MLEQFSADKWIPVLTGLLLIFASSVHAGGRSCAEGTRMACLGYGDKVVKNNAVCFDPLQCSQEGFVCKSDLNDLADEHEALLATHNDLVNEYNQLADEYEDTVREYDKFSRCVGVAHSVEEARVCAPDV